MNPRPTKTRTTPYLDVAIVGLGAIGIAHLDAVSQAHNARIAALVDVQRDHVEAIATRHGVPAFDDIDAMLANSDVDVVMICTPDALHVEPVRAAARAGKHVFLEKPIATTLDDANTILELTEAAGVAFTVGHCLRFDPKYVDLAQRIAHGQLGTIASLYARRQNKTANALRLQGRVSSLLFLGVHDIDILNWYAASPAVSVYTASRTGVMERHGFDVDDASWTTIRYASGVVGVVESGWLLPDDYPRSGHFELVATGEGGVARLDEFDEGLWVAAETFEHIPLVDRLTPQIEQFIDDVIHERQPRVTGKDAYLAMEIALAAERSAKLHGEVLIPSTHGATTFDSIPTG